MCGGPAGIAEDGAVKTYMLDYDHGFTAPMISRKSRMPHRSLHIISYAVVATVVIFLVVQCALQLAGKRNLNGWSQRRLAEQTAPCKPKPRKSSKKRKEAPRERREDEKEGQGLPKPWTPPKAAERKGSSADDREEGAQGAGYAMPFLSAGTAGVGGYMTGSEGGTKQKPGHPAHQQLPAEPATPDASPGSPVASAAAESDGKETQHSPTEEPRGHTTPVETEATAAAGGEQAEQAQAPAPDAPSGATGSAVSAGREDENEDGQGLPKPWTPPKDSERKGSSAADREEAAQGPGYSMPFLSAGTARVGGYLTGSEGGTKQKPGQPAHQQLPAGAEGGWADPGEGLAGSTQQLVFPFLDLSAVGATGGESGDQQADVPEQLPAQRMPDAQARIQGQVRQEAHSSMRLDWLIYQQLVQRVGTLGNGEQLYENGLSGSECLTHRRLNALQGISMQRNHGRSLEHPEPQQLLRTVENLEKLVQHMKWHPLQQEQPKKELNFLECLMRRRAYALQGVLMQRNHGGSLEHPEEERNSLDTRPNKYLPVRRVLGQIQGQVRQEAHSSMRLDWLIYQQLVQRVGTLGNGEQLYENCLSGSECLTRRRLNLLQGISMQRNHGRSVQHPKPQQLLRTVENLGRLVQHMKWRPLQQEQPKKELNFLYQRHNLLS
ncbi:uncharacterized protein EMH_0013510 [Eimeria mitis]|uniref:Transmembrane protein n=1 Tax=Eimeria mitis TaxID=44415 RepID=U6K4W0_9EIME|nr:uncharacterized protein EMH_0013510 [Eimeria mitis]CDJ32734.1 hypothetical protein EMH_0013510 [Eimeria mitis]